MSIESGSKWEGCNLRVGLTSGSTAGMCTKCTAKAILIDFYGIEIWIPLSLCEFSEEPNADGSYDVELPEWRQRKLEEELGEAY